MTRRLSPRSRGIAAISLMWLGFLGMYLGISGASIGWNAAGLVVTAIGVVLVLAP